MLEYDVDLALKVVLNIKMTEYPKEILQSINKINRRLFEVRGDFEAVNFIQVDNEDQSDLIYMVETLKRHIEGAMKRGDYDLALIKISEFRKLSEDESLPNHLV